MKVALEAGLRRETIHGRAFSEIVFMKITLWNRIQERNYTRKAFFGNRVYRNRSQTLIFAVNRRLNIHDLRKRTSVSILPVDFRFQAGNPYTRFSKKASRVQSYLIHFDFENTGYVFGPEKSTAAANYPISGDFRKTGYWKPCFLRGLRLHVSSFKKKKEYWICARRNASLKPEIHIHYFWNQGLFDSTLLSVCLISQKTIQ